MRSRETGYAPMNDASENRVDVPALAFSVCDRVGPCGRWLSVAGLAPLVQPGQTLSAWSEEIVAMWRFTRNNGITEGFHNKMELINRQAYGFRNFHN